MQHIGAAKGDAIRSQIRDLRDRYLENMNQGTLPAPAPRHEVARRLLSCAADTAPARLALPGAA